MRPRLGPRFRLRLPALSHGGLGARACDPRPWGVGANSLPSLIILSARQILRPVLVLPGQSPIIFPGPIPHSRLSLAPLAALGDNRPMDPRRAALPQGDQLLGELEAATPAPSWRPQIARVRYTHEDCVDRILAHPGISQNELAAVYGYSPAWISVVINSDAFQARLAARRGELVDPVLAATLNERFKALTVRSLEVLQEKLAQPSHQVPDQLALQAASLGAKSLGLGLPQTVAPTAATDLSRLAERLTAFVRREVAGDVVDVVARPVS